MHIFDSKRFAELRDQDGHSWIEGAKPNSARGNHFAAALMAARALGFAGYGREKIADPQSKEQYPILLTPAVDPIDEQKARRQINEAPWPAQGLKTLNPQRHDYCRRRSTRG